MDLNVFFLYELGQPDIGESQNVLLRISKPYYSNCSQRQDELAEEILERKRNEMLRQVLIRTNKNRYRLIGMFEGSPEGDILYEDNGTIDIELWVAKSGFGKPWIIMSQALDEENFFNIIKEDPDLGGMRPISPAFRVNALFLTENDFYLNGAGDVLKSEDSMNIIRQSIEVQMVDRVLRTFLYQGWFFQQVYDPVYLKDESFEIPIRHECNDVTLEALYSPYKIQISLHTGSDYYNRVTEFSFGYFNRDGLDKTLELIISWQDRVSLDNFSSFIREIEDKKVPYTVIYKS